MVEPKPKSRSLPRPGCRVETPAAVRPRILGRIKQRRKESRRPVCRLMAKVRCKLHSKTWSMRTVETERNGLKQDI